jgi:hypothetical protein
LHTSISASENAEREQKNRICRKLEDYQFQKRLLTWRKIFFLWKQMTTKQTIKWFMKYTLVTYCLEKIWWNQWAIIRANSKRDANVPTLLYSDELHEKTHHLCLRLSTVHTVSSKSRRLHIWWDVSTIGLSTLETSTSMKKNISSLETNDNETNH